jgi:hypothetical protein
MPDYCACVACGSYSEFSGIEPSSGRFAAAFGHVLRADFPNLMK